MELKQKYFGYYRMPSDMIEKEFLKGHMNVYLMGVHPSDMKETVRVLKRVGDLNGKAWMGIWNAVVKYDPAVTLRDGWQSALRYMMTCLAEEGVLDTVLGFYFDEPFLCGMKKEDYRALTGFLRENWQSKRVFTIFATNAIAPDVWSSGNDNVIDPETVEFVTDAGYDMYWDVRGDGIIPFEKVNVSLKERFGRDDVNIWYVPCIMNYRGNKDEAYAIAHTNAMYEFLKQEKNPGGLLCYAYAIEDHDGEVCNIGFCEMRDRSESPWTALENRLLKIGKEIVG